MNTYMCNYNFIFILLYKYVDNIIVLFKYELVYSFIYVYLNGISYAKISYEKTGRTDTIQVLKEFNSQSLTTQAKKGEQLVSMMPAIKKAVDLLGDDIVDLSTENDALKNKMGSYDETWLEES